MTIDYKALARSAQDCIGLFEHLDSLLPKEHRQQVQVRVADLRTVVSLLNGMAQEKPVASAMFVADHMPRVQWSEAGLELLGKVNLYTHPVPQPQPERQPVSEPTRSEQLRAAGFTRRDDRIECDECGKRYSPQKLPIHKCEPTEAQIEAKARELCRQEAEVDFDFDFHWAEGAEEFRAAARAALVAKEKNNADQ